MAVFTIIGIAVVFGFIINFMNKPASPPPARVLNYKDRSTIVGLIISTTESLKNRNYPDALKLINYAIALDPSNQHFKTLKLTLTEAIQNNSYFSEEEIEHTFTVLTMMY